MSGGIAAGGIAATAVSLAVLAGTVVVQVERSLSWPAAVPPEPPTVCSPCPELFCGPCVCEVKAEACPSVPACEEPVKVVEQSCAAATAGGFSVGELVAASVAGASAAYVARRPAAPAAEPPSIAPTLRRKAGKQLTTARVVDASDL